MSFQDKAGGSRRGLSKQGHVYEIVLLDGHIIFTNSDRNETFVISEEDADLLRFYWRCDAFGYPVHAFYRDGKVCYEKMHRVIAARMGIIDDNDMIDHIDREKKNNSRGNLRSVNALQNSLNSKAMKHSKSGIRGVCWCPPQNRWKATMNPKFKYFRTQEEAIAQRQTWEAERWSEAIAMKAGK